MMYMQVTVFGASGKVGRLVVAELLKRGHTVTAFVHRSNPFERAPRLNVMRGDTGKADDVLKALQGSDAVISCLGSWGRPPYDVLTKAMDQIVPTMEAHGIKRFITLTGHGANPPYTVPSFGHKLVMKLLSPLPAGKVFHDGEQHMKLLADSSLEWTTLRSPVMKGQGPAPDGAGQGTDSYILTERAGLALIALIPRQAVAAALVDQLDSTEYFHHAPVIKPGVTDKL